MGRVVENFRAAEEQYAAIGVDVAAAMALLKTIKVSLHCWQGDDVQGFISNQGLSGGLAVTGNYPGKARNGDELRADLDKVFSLIPGTHKLNLHAIYAESDKPLPLEEVEASHFSRWIEWAKERGRGLDFNPTCFSHPLAADGFTLSHVKREVRNFWIDHCRRSRKVGETFGRELGQPAVTNIWIPDGYKDTPVDRLSPRVRLKEALDEIFKLEIDPRFNLDAVESKLFGIGSESYVTGSHEFYMGYAIENNKILCLDMGHFHPTEAISDKLSAISLFCNKILLHVSRPVRWDSDHVVTMNDELLELCRELIRGDLLAKTYIGTDFFDAGINRIAAWVIGVRNLLKALLRAALEPTEELKRAEYEGDYTKRLALQEELKMSPFGAVWDYYCEQEGVPTGISWLDEVKRYEKQVLSKRDTSK